MGSYVGQHVQRCIGPPQHIKHPLRFSHAPQIMSTFRCTFRNPACNVFFPHHKSAIPLPMSTHHTTSPPSCLRSPLTSSQVHHPACHVHLPSVQVRNLACDVRHPASSVLLPTYMYATSIYKSAILLAMSTYHTISPSPRMQCPLTCLQVRHTVCNFNQPIYKSAA